MTREDFVAGLRASADFYEQHPEIKLPHENYLYNFCLNTREEAMAVVRALGSCVKVYHDTTFTIVKKISPDFELRFVFQRSAVCERVVSGKKVIPSHVVPERVEETYEWRCSEPLLAPENEVA